MGTLQPSLTARIRDLLGDDPERLDPPADRLTVGAAARRCRPGEVVAARRGRQELAVIKLDDGRCYAVEDRCPHDGGRLSDGFVEDGRLVCARHCWEFDLESGRCENAGGGRVFVKSRRL